MDQPTYIKGTRGKMEMRSLVVQHQSLLGETISTWEQLGQINQQQDDLKDHPLLLQEPFHTGICRSSGKLHLTQKACQTPPSSSSCWRKRLRCCMEITQALGACGCKWRHGVLCDQGLGADTEGFFPPSLPRESATAATQPWALLERDKV